MCKIRKHGGFSQSRLHIHLKTCFLIRPHKVYYLFLVHPSFRNWPGHQAFYFYKWDLNINFYDSLWLALCIFSKVYIALILCLLTLMCTFVCACISCHNVSLWQFVCLCVITWQKIDQAEGPETYVTGSGKTGLIATITDIHFLPVRESCTHALPRNTKYLIIDGQVCFYRRLFTNHQGAFHGPGGH